VAPPMSQGVGDYVAAQTATVRRGIKTLENDPDAGIQKVRNMLERENLALAALSAAVAARQKAAGDVDASTAAIDAARVKALDLNRAFSAGIKKSGGEIGTEAIAWAEYYKALSEVARTISTTPPVPTVVSRPADQATRPAPITPVPLVRYTGDWVLAPNGANHGGKPESLDLTVREENGRCTGSLAARFILPPGSGDDPVMRFDFAGDFKNTVRQMFDLETNDGAKGTIELIPGSAFNLLEINVQIDAKPGKVGQANVVLVKK